MTEIEQRMAETDEAIDAAIEAAPFSEYSGAEADFTRAFMKADEALTAERTACRAEIARLRTAAEEAMQSIDEAIVLVDEGRSGTRAIEKSGLNDVLAGLRAALSPAPDDRLRGTNPELAVVDEFTTAPQPASRSS